MTTLLSPSEAVRRFDFGPDDCLYLDHLGRRVLADVEGAGTFQIQSIEAPFEVRVDERSTDRLAGTFETCVEVVAAGQGRSTTHVRVGKTKPPVRPIQKGESFAGRGWVFSSAGPVHIDGRWEPALAPVPDFPLPFFSTCEGEGLSVVVVGSPAQLVDGFDVSDEKALATRGWKVQNISRLSELSSAFLDGTSFEGLVASHLNAASWRSPVPEGCEGLVVWKLYDQFHGRQRARVLVDGRPVGWWYEPAQDRQRRWRWSRFGIDRDYLAGKREIEIRIDPPAGAALWSVSRIEVWALRP